MSPLIFLKFGGKFLISALSSGITWIAEHLSSKKPLEPMLVTSTVIPVPNLQSISYKSSHTNDYYDDSSTIIHVLMPITDLAQHKNKDSSNYYTYLMIFIVLALTFIGFIAYRTWNRIKKNQFTNYRDSQEQTTPTSPAVSQSEQQRSSLWSTSTRGKRIQKLDYV